MDGEREDLAQSRAYRSPPASRACAARLRPSALGVCSEEDSLSARASEAVFAWDDDAAATHCRDRWRRHWRAVRRQCADRARLRRFGLRAGAGARRGRRRRVPDAEQRAPVAAGRSWTAVETMGRQGRPRLALFSPRRHADRTGAGDELVGLERDLRHASRRSRRDAGERIAVRRGAHRPSLHRLRADG